MRRVLWYNIEIAAHALKYVPKNQWTTTVNSWIAHAHAAHCYSKHFHRPHPKWGSGALSEVIGLSINEIKRPVAELCEEMAAVFTALAENRRTVDPR